MELQKEQTALGGLSLDNGGKREPKPRASIPASNSSKCNPNPMHKPLASMYCCSMASTHRALKSWKQMRWDHSQLMEIPLLRHFDGCSWWPLIALTESLNSNAKFLMGICPFIPFPTREQSCVLGIEKLGRIRPQLLCVQFAYSFHFTKKPQWWIIITCDPKVKEWVSVMGSEVCSSPLKPDQGC